MRFWDSSALVPLLVKESSSAQMRRLLTEDPEVVLWWGTRIELSSALARRVRTGQLAEQDLSTARSTIEGLVVGSHGVEPHRELQSLAVDRLFRRPLRAADSLQLAAAVTWAEGKPATSEFVCLDLRLRAAAEAVGFSVLPAEA